MANETDSNTAPQTTPAAPAAPKDTRPEHLAAWFDAKDDAERKSAVTRFPLLRVIFSEAQNY